MKLVWKSFSICKDGNREEENEDAVFPVIASGTSLWSDGFSCAMADGATQASFSKLWANLLVKETGRSQNLTQDLPQALFAAHSSWKNQLNQIDLPWPVEVKMQQGAHSTLLWFHIWHRNGAGPLNDAPPRGWTSNAIGDTCVFQVTKGKSSEGFPFTSSEQFSNSPELVSTNSLHRAKLTQRTISGTWQKGDYFLIASDALAEWLVRNLASQKTTWASVHDHLTSLVRYQNWIRALRKHNLIKNDDTTLICLSVDE
jgi:serine/threonine protein phosphatase PrpC